MAEEGDEKKTPPGLTTNEMLWILLAIVAISLIWRVVGNLF